MVYVNLAINWAIALGIKDKKVYKYLKKYYRYTRIIHSSKKNCYMIVFSGWLFRHKYGRETFSGTHTFYLTDVHEHRITYYRHDQPFKKFEMLRHLTPPTECGRQGEVYQIDIHTGVAVIKIGIYWFGK